MLWLQAAARRCGHAAIAFSLCLLVLSCAMEAKFAWYAPPGGPTIDARSTKAIPADTRDSPTDDSVSVETPHAGTSCFLLAALAATWLLTEGRTSANQFPSSLRHKPSTIYFSPQVSFRPPPAW
ncbi:MAG: hypothetical protein ACRD25_09630 [Terracidiphilus sp.]